MDISSHEDQTRAKIIIIYALWNFEWVSNRCVRFSNHSQWFLFSWDSFLLPEWQNRPARVLLCMCVSYSCVFSLCGGRIIVDLQGLKTMSRHTSGTHSPSVSQWNTINSCLMLPHGHCPHALKAEGKQEAMRPNKLSFMCSWNDSRQFLLLSLSLQP